MGWNNGPGQGGGGWASGDSWGLLPPMTRAELAAFCEARGHPVSAEWVAADPDAPATWQPHEIEAMTDGR